MTQQLNHLSLHLFILVCSATRTVANQGAPSSAKT
ncbi:hypothetical protein SRABI112_00146 [Pseudomonas mediterranea]|jgi:hypothetical protein|uniref:Uncharacterized protein n=1 Tax=Pseudomonas mediterranea TaxID=183795 RepID=A0AAX2DH90_9PSED|nr:hypothetical protein SRABI112_00146 [Pseudomonas mediterranea]SDU65149.1 hypothetical protein SAMN05216476_3992 [Pseudomonas mediterranea]